jgi:DNA-binding GntR family transcriptional regulator
MPGWPSSTSGPPLRTDSSPLAPPRWHGSVGGVAPTTTLTPIDRRLGVGRQVHEAILQAIIAVELEPGEALSEKELSERLGVSRTPVREALIKLRGEGLVDIISQVGTFVAKIDVEHVHEAQFIRQALECACVRDLVARATKSDVAELREVLAEQRRFQERDDDRGFYVADERLHCRMAEMAGHGAVWATVKRSKVHLDRVRRLSLTLPAVIGHLVDQHQAVVDAVEAGDADAAESALRTHLSEVLQVLGPLSERHPQYFVSRPQAPVVAA